MRPNRYSAQRGIRRARASGQTGDNGPRSSRDGLAADEGNYSRNASTRLMSLSIAVRADGLFGGAAEMPRLPVRNTSVRARHRFGHFLQKRCSARSGRANAYPSVDIPIRRSVVEAGSRPDDVADHPARRLATNNRRSTRRRERDNIACAVRISG
jgi:hypothetical protein